MKTRDWEHVVRAAQHLGCIVGLETDAFVYLVRGAIRFYAVRKFLVSTRVQREIIHALEFSEHEWLNAISETTN